MKRICLFILLFLAFNSAIKSSAARAAPAQTVSRKTLKVAIFLYADVDPIDVSGPLDVFTMANEMAPGSYQVFTVAASANNVATKQGILTIKPRYTVQNCPQADILVIPGASLIRLHELYKERAVMDWLKREAGGAQQVMSVCTGAFLLGKAGLLTGRKATTHWFALDSLQQEFPQTTAIQGARFVEDGKIITTAGVTSGLDGALHLVEKNSGAKIADSVARAIQYRRGTPAYPDQPLMALKKPTATSITPAAAPKSGQKLASNTDPVCGMAVKPETKITFLYQGKLYGFCAEHCRREFAANPMQYLKNKK